MFFDGWRKLIERYANRSNILGADIKNEPFEATVSSLQFLLAAIELDCNSR